MRLLYVEDDERIAALASAYLRKGGLAVDVAASGEDAMRLSALNEYDVAVLDLRLPGIDGMEVCRRIRRAGKGVRILMATARDSVGDRIEGLNTGADDYIVKPYALGELEARVRALLRRPATVIPDTLRVDDLSLDTATRVAHRGDRAIHLTSKEFAVLEFLMRHAGEVTTRERLSAHAWDDNYDPASNVIDVYIARLRKKIDAGAAVPLLGTIRGAGYRLGSPQPRRR
jgi:DNA-binding response OmpR family regulator